MAQLVAEVEVVRRRVVEIHRSLDQSQPKDPCVEVEIALRIACDRGYVVDS